MSPTLVALLASLALSGCVADVAFDGPGQPVESETRANLFGTGHGLNVDPANHASRPCSDLDAAHLHVTGFLRMPVKFTADDWSWSNGGFEGYLTCIRATMPTIKVVGTLGDDSLDPSLGLHNPYYDGTCDAHQLDVADDCPAFGQWVSSYLADIDPTILQQFDIIEVYNEPDDRWTGNGFRAGALTSAMPPAAYAQLLNAFYAQFSGQLGIPIMMGGMDSGNPHYLSAMVQATGFYSSDFVNIHPYGSYPSHVPGFAFDAAAASCTSTYGTLDPCFGSTEDAIASYTQEFAADGNTGELIITEWGTHNSAQLPGYIHAWFADSQTRASNVMLFAYSDANQAGFGLKDVDDNAKPAYQAFAHP
jgi:hypothetical protein